MHNKSTYGLYGGLIERYLSLLFEGIIVDLVL